MLLSFYLTIFLSILKYFYLSYFTIHLYFYLTNYLTIYRVSQKNATFLIFNNSKTVWGFYSNFCKRCQICKMYDYTCIYALITILLSLFQSLYLSLFLSLFLSLSLSLFLSHKSLFTYEF